MKKLLWIIIPVVLVILFALFTFTLNEWEQAVVLQFGKPIRVVKSPGLHFRIPAPIQSISIFDTRVLDYDSSPTEILTMDKKNLVVDNYAKWKIIDPLKFLKTVATENGAQSRLDDIIYSELRVELGKHNLDEIMATMRESLMRKVTVVSDSIALSYGISVLDVRIKRADLPPENEASVYARMRAERKRQANQYRSEGEEEALKIRAETDKQVAIITAEARQKSAKILGEGEAEAIRIFSEALEKDPEFYEFIRSMQAYEKIIDNNSKIVISSESELFKFLK